VNTTFPVRKVVRSRSLRSAIRTETGLIASPLVIRDRHEEQDALALGKLDRDKIERDEPARLSLLPRPDSADFLGTGEDVPAVLVLADDAGEGHPEHGEV
jgi:hypothetical protein